MKILDLALSVLLFVLLVLDMHNGEPGFMLMDFSIPFWIAGAVSVVYLVISVLNLFFGSEDRKRKR